MKTLIVTTPGRNKLTKLTQDHSNSFDICTYEDIVVRINAEEVQIAIGDRQLSDYKAIILRAPNYDRELSMTIAFQAQKLGLRVVNKYMTTFTYGYKLFQTIKAHGAGIRVPKTLYVHSNAIALQQDLIINTFSLPFIMKVVDGQAGQNNFLISKPTDVLKNYKKNAKYIFQEFIPNNFDLRVFAINYKVVSIKKRIRKGTESHRNNLTVGGSAEYIEEWESNSEYKELIKNSEILSKEFLIDLSGVDFIVNKENQLTYFLELNSTPGFGYGTIDEEKLIEFIESL